MELIKHCYVCKHFIILTKILWNLYDYCVDILPRQEYRCNTFLNLKDYAFLFVSILEEVRHVYQYIVTFISIYISGSKKEL